MNTNIVFTAEGRSNTKEERITDARSNVEKAPVPPSYISNDTKEELCYEYIMSFVDQFKALYPKRKDLFLTRPNEYGVSKFVCTTLRPQEVPYSELYDMYECASFFAGFILYEPLDPPTAVPRVLPSPTFTLKRHTGDSFDMANLVCSYLIGSGYDAHVVNGYAPRSITLKDQSSSPCPITVSSSTSTPTSTSTTSSAKTAESKSNDDSSSPADDSNPYKPPNNKVRVSQYLIDAAERKRVAGLDTFKLWKEEQPADGAGASDKADALYGKRVHAWILVRAGRRDVKENLFIEPTTGRVYPTGRCPYLGIESIWNAKNYWVNTKPEEGLKNLDYDLDNASSGSWEFVYISTGNPLAKNQQQSNQEDEEGEVDELAAMTAVEPEADEEDKDEEDDAGAVEMSLDAPPSWVEPLNMDRGLYLTRYPPYGKRTVVYSCAKADFYARNSHAQGMVMRVTVYLDRARTVVKEAHEWYENRKDKMYKRVRHYVGGYRLVESFHPGSVGEVQTWTEWPGKRREIHFYVEGRLDRLAYREEDIGREIVERFQDRTDRLTYRCVVLSMDKADSGPRVFALPGGTLCAELYVLRMTVLYDIDPADFKGECIQERIFNVVEGQAVTQCHYAKFKVTNLVKHYHHSSGGDQHADPAGDVEPTEEDPELLQEMASLERETYAQVKLAFSQMNAVTHYRTESEATAAKASTDSSSDTNSMVERTVFEAALDRAETVANTEAAANAQGNSNEVDPDDVDYLTPFLRNVRDTASLSAEEALDVRQSCLDAFKARLVERANIIQARLADENAKLVRKQEQFQRSQRDGDLSTEEYEKFCTEAMFRISILEQRQAAHEELALKKFADLDAQLNSDLRLRALRVKE